MKLPPPALILLRTVATLEISAVIGQAGWAAAFLGGDGQYLRHHSVGALVTLVICHAGAATYLLLRRSAGKVNVVLAITLAVAVAIQYGLGEAGVRAPHIFLGILIAMLSTALTSWTFRHSPAPTHNNDVTATPVAQERTSTQAARQPPSIRDSHRDPDTGLAKQVRA